MLYVAVKKIQDTVNLICIDMPMGKEIQAVGFYVEGCCIDKTIFQIMTFNSILNAFQQFKTS